MRNSTRRLRILDTFPVGLKGLMLVGILAALMSTADICILTASANGSRDVYQRFINPTANDRNQMLVLHGATVVWGVLGTITALALVSLTESALDIWWTLSSILSGGIVGLFLLGLISRTAGNAAGITGVLTGVLVIAWMVIKCGKTGQRSRPRNIKRSWTVSLPN